MSGIGPSTAPPGWYPDPTGNLRWWTGTTWGAYAPPPTAVPTGPATAGGTGSGRSDATSLALLAQLGQLFGGFIIPLVVYLTAGKEDPFIRHHSAEALNFSITYLILAFASFAGFVAGVLFPPLFIALILWFFALVIGHLVFIIVAAVHAYRGEWWRYPINIRLVPGAV